MAVKPTPNNNLYKGLVFDGVDSRNYGIYITGDAVFNSPERDVEMIEIPGRNGAYALDKGRFGNIEVSYPAGIFGDTEADFREGIRAFRNALASRKGYKRLEDDYNPTEYRMAVYKSGLEVTPTALKAGEFTITFDCKPQRFLVSGESRIALQRGVPFVNPTLFPSSPLYDFEATGDGFFVVGDYKVNVVNATIGTVVLNMSRQTNTSSGMFVDRLSIGNTAVINNGDTFTIGGAEYTAQYRSGYSLDRVEPSSVDGISVTSSVNLDRFGISLSAAEVSFVYGTASTVNQTADVVVVFGTSGVTTSGTFTATYEYDGNATITVTFTYATFSPVPISLLSKTNKSAFSGTAESTQSTIQSTVYLDCELGEAYSIIDGNVTSMNNYVSFGADLPVINAGSNEVTFTNSITSLGVVPRFWEV